MKLHNYYKKLGNLIVLILSAFSLNAQNLETVQETEYDNIYFQIRKVKTIDSYSNKITSSNGGITYDRYIETTYKYPFDFPVDNSVMNGMTNANMISTVIEEIKELVILNAPRKLLSHMKTTYQFVNGMYLPKMIETKLGDAQDFDKKIEFLEYDTSGNLTKYWEKNGITTQLEYFGNSDIGKVNLLKSQTVGFGGSSPQTTTYEYKPLVGISSITDPNSRPTTYAYDTFGRLTSVDGPAGKKEYSYHFVGQDVDKPITTATITKTAVVCELCCKVEADAGSNSPIQNCTSGQITLNIGASTTGTDVTYSWEGPNQFKSNMKSPIISGDLSKAAGIYTLTVTRSNSSCEAKDIATTEVILDCTCPFTVNTNGTTTGPLNCYETIFLKANCQGCSTGTIAAGAETWAANGQFSNGDTGFGCEALNHFITSNPNNIDGSFNFFGDHTGNIGANNMLLVGHSENRQEKVWYQTVTVKPNTRYILSAWVAGAYNNNPNKVFFNIDGQSLPEKIDLSSTPGGQWVKLQSVWISGTATSVVFAIRKENTQGHNWFALDDISISEAPKAEFVWTGPNGFSATGKNQFIRNVALKNSGTYTLKVTDKGCTKIISVPITVNCPTCTQPITVTTYTNSPVSCGSPIIFNTSATNGSTFSWYRIDSDSTFTSFPNTERNPTLTAPSTPGRNRYAYGVDIRKGGCTASFTTPVEVRCESSLVDLSLSLRVEGGSTTVTQNQVFPICADFKNEGLNNVFSVRGKVLLPDCLEFVTTNSPWGLNTGTEPNTGGYFEDIWYNSATREVSNESPLSRRGADFWKYWGVPIGAGSTRSMCFYVKALSAGTIIIKGQITENVDQYRKQYLDADSEPNNGYDNGEDDRALLTLNAGTNTLDISKYQVLASNTPYTDQLDVTTTNIGWNTVISDASWIKLDKTSGLAGVTTVTLNLLNNDSPKSRFGSIKFYAACGLEKIITIRQSGREDCPTVSVSSNNPYCGDPIKLYSQIVPASSKDLVTNGDFESGNTGFSSENMHIYDPNLGGTLSYFVSANPKSETGGLWFTESECQVENKNPVCSVMNRVRVMWRGDCCQDRQNGATIQGSNNGGVWDVLYTFGNAPITGGWQDVTLSNTKKYSFVRFVASPSGYGDLAEIEFYSGTTKLSGRFMGSPGIWAGMTSTYQVSNTVDGNVNTVWSGSGPGSENYVGYELDNCGAAPDPTGNTGFGKQLAVVASWSPGQPFWSQTINVDPYTDYTISLKTAQLGNYDNVPVRLIFEIDGVPVNVQDQTSPFGCIWKKISGIWNSGQKFGPVKLLLRFENPNSSGKVFAVDDISVKPVQQGTVSNAAITYLWTGPGFGVNDPEQFKANPVIANSDASKSGRYLLTVTQNGCSSSESVDVSIGCSYLTCPAPTITAIGNVVCANLGQTATLTAAGCPAGSTVKWSDGQNGVTITTPKLVNSTVYSAKCLTACGLSIKSNEITIHVIGKSSPPRILSDPSVCVYPGTDGFTLKSTGCVNGTVRWSDGRIGTEIWIPGGLTMGTTFTYSVKCITECGESDSSPEVRIMVCCDVQNPTINLIQSPVCSIDGSNVILEGSCKVGKLVWYDMKGAYLGEGTRLEKPVYDPTTFYARCINPGTCISDFVGINVAGKIKPSRPFIIPSPYKAGLDLDVRINTTISLEAKGCSSTAEVNWSVLNYTIPDTKARIIYITPTVADVNIFATVTCKENNDCISDPSETIKITGKSGPCLPNTLFAIITPASSSITVPQGPEGSTTTLVASGCHGVVNWTNSDASLTFSAVTGSDNENVPFSVPTNTVGRFNFYATCSESGVSTKCDASLSREVVVSAVQCNLVANLSSNASCESAVLSVGVTKNGSAYNDISKLKYEWSVKGTTGDFVPIVNTSNTYTATINGDYQVKVTDLNDWTCVTVSNVVNVKILKTSDIPRVIVDNQVVSDNKVSVGLSGSVQFHVEGCPAYSIPEWLVTDNSGILPNTIVSGNGGTFSGFTKTGEFSVKVRCKTTTPSCNTSYSDNITVSVTGGLGCDLLISSSSDEASLGTGITLTAQGCNNGSVTWMEGSTTLGSGRTIVITKSVSGTYTITAICSVNTPCTANKKLIFSCAAAPFLYYINPTKKVCTGQYILLGASGCDGGTVTWYSSADATTGFATGFTLNTKDYPTVWATCTKNGCTSAKVPIETNSDVDIGRVDIMPNCDVSQLTVSPANGGFTYEWTKDNNPISGQSNVMNVVYGTGTYAVKVSNAAGCYRSTSYTVGPGNFYPIITLTGPTRVDPCRFDYSFDASVSSNNDVIPNYSFYSWYENGIVLGNVTTGSFTRSNLEPSKNYTYTLFVNKQYILSGNKLSCTSSVTRNLTTPAGINAPVLQKDSINCSITATLCPERSAIEWSTFDGTTFTYAGTGNSISATAGVTYVARCKVDNCYSNYSGKAKIVSCSSNASCILPFANYGKNNGEGLNVVLTNNLGHKRMTAKFASYCIPDQLILKVQRANTTEWKDLNPDNDQCTGTGVRYGKNKSGGFTVDFEVWNGDKLWIQVNTPCMGKCTDNVPINCDNNRCDCYQCDNETVTKWDLTFGCSDY